MHRPALAYFKRSRYSYGWPYSIGIRAHNEPKKIESPNHVFTFPRDALFSVRQEDRYVFPPAGTEGRFATPSHKLNKTFKFRDYAPKAFRKLREIYGIDEVFVGSLFLCFGSVRIKFTSVYRGAFSSCRVAASYEREDKVSRFSCVSSRGNTGYLVESTY